MNESINFSPNAYFFITLLFRMEKVLFFSIVLPIDCCGVKQLFRLALLK